MMQGIDARSGHLASRICADCFARGLIVETSGSFDEVVKALAPLTSPTEQFDRGFVFVEVATRSMGT